MESFDKFISFLSFSFSRTIGIRNYWLKISFGLKIALLLSLRSLEMGLTAYEGKIDRLGFSEN